METNNDKEGVFTIDDVICEQSESEENIDDNDMFFKMNKEEKQSSDSTKSSSNEPLTCVRNITEKRDKIDKTIA